MSEWKTASVCACEWTCESGKGCPPPTPSAGHVAFNEIKRDKAPTVCEGDAEEDNVPFLKNVILRQRGPKVAREIRPKALQGRLRSVPQVFASLAIEVITGLRFLEGLLEDLAFVLGKDWEVSVLHL